jgi:Asp-tRNA(Asn)/Glu-tRNA(Gln) amidotransferase A subunit family amidase
MPSLCSLQKKLQSKEISEIDCFSEALRTIQTLNPLLNAITNCDAERITKSVSAKTEILPLSGIPLVVDDSVPVQEFAYIYGPEKKHIQHPPTSYFMSEALLRKGATIIGSGKVSEFRLSSFLEGENAPTNPVFKEEGCSSINGASLAVYTNMARAGFVTDLLGTKSSASLLGLPLFTPSITVDLFTPHSYYSDLRKKIALRPSIISQSVQDISYLFSAFTTSLCKRDKHVYRLGWSPNLDNLLPQQAGHETLEKYITSLSSHQCEVKEVSLDLDFSVYVHIANILACAKYIPILNLVEKQKILSIDDLSTCTKSWLNYAKEIPGVVLSYSLGYLALIEKILDEMLETMDFFISPAMPFHKRSTQTFLEHKCLPSDLSKAFTNWGYILPLAFTGHPSAIISLAETEDGEPLAIQIIGKKGQDHELIHFMKHLNSCFSYKPRKHTI